MTVTLDHTIVQASDNLASARFLAGILGVPGPDGPGHFAAVTTDNNVALDFMTVGEVSPQHYAFTVSAVEFDAAFERVHTLGLTIYAQPDRSGEGEIYKRQGRRGFYFDDPDRNLMELIEVPGSVIDDEIRAVVAEWGIAELHGDVDALDRLLAAEFCGAGPLGFVLDRAAWLNRFAGGLHNAALSFDGLRIHTHGESVVVVAVLDQQARFNDFDSSGRYRVSFVVVRGGGRWQIASCHVGPLDARAEVS